MPEPQLIQLTCSSCRHAEVLAMGEVARRLTSQGMLRREREPAWDLLCELLQNASRNWKCARCGQEGLIVEKPEGQEEDWGMARQCESCGQTIDSDRLEVFPDAKRSSVCQQKEEQGTNSDEEPQFCERCGALLKLSPSRGAGITRYEYRCSECGAR